MNKIIMNEVIEGINFDKLESNIIITAPIPYIGVQKPCKKPLL